MLYVLLAVVIAIVAFLLGYYLREARELLAEAKRMLTDRKKADDEAPTSSMVEPMSMEEIARRQHEQVMKDLNQ